MSSRRLYLRVLDVMVTFLASPVRVMAAFLRLCLAFAMVAPFLWMGWAGLWLLPPILGAWMFLTLTIYGPRVMIHSNPPWRLWLWRHIEVWWVTPTEDDR